MSVMKFVLFSAMLKTSSACSVFNNFFLTASSIQTKQHSMKPTHRKKKMALFIQYHYRREVYYESTVQVEFPVISLL